MMFRNHVGFVAGRARIGDCGANNRSTDAITQTGSPETYSTTIGCYCATKQIDWYSSTRAHGKEQYPFYIHVYYDKQREASEILNMTELVESFKGRLEKGEIPNAPLFRKFFKKKKTRLKVQSQKIFTSSMFIPGLLLFKPVGALCLDPTKWNPPPKRSIFTARKIRLKKAFITTKINAEDGELDVGNAALE